MAGKRRKFRWYLFPFALLYGLAVGIRNRLFDYDILKSSEFDIPIISVGNITVGGTGKTPHVEYLVSMLKEHFRIATLSRGYKRRTKGFLLASETSAVNEIGDEPKQIKRKFPDIDVAVDNSRVKGILRLTEEKFPSKLDVIILDDAYQHRYVQPGINILLIDYNRPLSDDYLLPVGTLRERSYSRNRANIIIMAKSPRDIKPIDQRLILKRLKLFPYQSLYFTTFRYKEPRPVFTVATRSITFSKLAGEKTVVLLVTGIAYPEPLLNHLRECDIEVRHLRFKDHHEFKQRDIQAINNEADKIEKPQKIIITTEKDAVRLHENEYISDQIKELLYYIPVEIEFLKNEDEIFNKQITDYVRKNKRNYHIHKGERRLYS